MAIATASNERCLHPPSQRRALLGRLLPVRLELALLGLYLLAWVAAEAQFEAPRAVAVPHAHAWLGFERSVGIAIEHDVAAFASRHGFANVLLWSYDNLHLAVPFAILAAVRLLRPPGYPWLRTTFVLLHLPVLAVAALFPLAPPHAVRGLVPQRLAEAATSGAAGPLSNTTAAAASIHFAWAACVAAGGVLLARRSRWTLVLTLYPAWNFLVIVGTGNHYVLDAIVGAGCFALAAAAAALVHRGVRAAPVRATGAGHAARIVAGAALVAYAIEASSSTLRPNGIPVVAATGVCGAALLLAPQRLPRLRKASR